MCGGNKASRFYIKANPNRKVTIYYLRKRAWDWSPMIGRMQPEFLSYKNQNKEGMQPPLCLWVKNTLMEIDVSSLFGLIHFGPVLDSLTRAVNFLNLVENFKNNVDQIRYRLIYFQNIFILRAFVQRCNNFFFTKDK